MKTHLILLVSLLAFTPVAHSEDMPLIIQGKERREVTGKVISKSATTLSVETVRVTTDGLNYFTNKFLTYVSHYPQISLVSVGDKFTSKDCYLIGAPVVPAMVYYWKPKPVIVPKTRVWN